MNTRDILDGAGLRARHAASVAKRREAKLQEIERKERESEHFARQARERAAERARLWRGVLSRGRVS